MKNFQFLAMFLALLGTSAVYATANEEMSVLGGTEGTELPQSRLTVRGQVKDDAGEPLPGPDFVNAYPKIHQRTMGQCIDGVS